MCNKIFIDRCHLCAYCTSFKTGEKNTETDTPYYEIFCNHFNLNRTVDVVEGFTNVLLYEIPNECPILKEQNDNE